MPEMEIWLTVLIIVLVLAVFILLLRLLALRHALREVADELDEKLAADTNTLISISSGDRAVRALAARINAQLQALRRERLRLQNGDAALKSAVANISHDLRTPLTAICGYLDLLSQEYASPQAARYLAIVRERAGAMRVLTQELFQYSVLSSAAEEMKCAPVCLNDILEQSLAGLYAELSAREIAPVIHFPEKPVVRMLDAGALRRIFDNILSNAAKYSGGDLDVALAADGTVEFTNSAPGLTRVQAERLFDRFYTVQTGSGATGLGLSIARMLTEKMGGTISAQYQAGRLCICVRFSQVQTH